jgi:PAP2 superfamily
MKKQNLHFFLTATASVLLIPASIYARIRIGLTLATLYSLVGWAIQSTISAIILYQLGVPGSWDAFRHHRGRFIPIAAVAVLLICILGLAAGSAVAFVVFGLSEFVFRGGNWKGVAQAVLPWLYLSFGIQIAFIFSGIIVCLRPCTLYDAALNNLDKHLMFGFTVNHISNTFYSLYFAAEWVYYGLFGIIGAALLLLCLFGDKRGAMQLSGTILMAYFMSISVFYFLPALGPFVDGEFPRRTFTATAQQDSLVYARLLYHHSQWISLVAKNYFVAFPSLHLAQPLIAAWFLRRWKRVSIVVVAYSTLLVPSILILRWHYLVDIIGGLIVGVASIAITSFLDSDSEYRRTSGPLTARATAAETCVN